MPDQNESELPNRPTETHIEKIDEHARDLSLPEAVRNELKERMQSPDWMREVAKMQKELRVDEVTGLMVEKVFEYDIRHKLEEHSNQVIDHFADKVKAKLPANDQERVVIARELVGVFKPQLTPTGHNYLIQRLSQHLTDKGSISPEDMVYSIQEAYLQSELSKMVIIAGDFQKLKACNVFGETQRPDMDGERFVDEFGFKVWGRRMQALSVLTGDHNYETSLKSLNGTTEKHPTDQQARLAVSEASYLDQVIQLTSRSDLEYLRAHDIKIVPGRRDKSGDEAIYEAQKPSEATAQDIEVIERVIKAVSHVEIGNYNEEQKIGKVKIAERILGNRSVLKVDQAMSASLDIRLGSVKASDEYDKALIDISDAAEIDGREDDPEFINQQATLRLISEAKRKMGENRQSETIDLVFQAVNGDRNAQLNLVLLIEQSRFDYRSDLLAAALNRFPRDEAISREDFDKFVTPELMRERRTQPRPKP